MPHPRIARGGFTIVELLVVIAVITILIGILLPVISSAQDSAAAVRSLNNLQQITGALSPYAMDHDYMLPGERGIARAPKSQYGTPDPTDPKSWGQLDSTNPDHWQSPNAGNDAWDWATGYGKLGAGGYVDNYKAWLDPGDGHKRAGYGKTLFTAQPTPSARTHDDSDYYTYSYTMFEHLGEDNYGGFTIEPVNIQSIERHSEVLAFGEENTGRVDPAEVAGMSDVPRINDVRFANVDVTEPRHHGRSQASFLDGSARAFPANITPMKRDSDAGKKYHRHEW